MLYSKLNWVLNYISSPSKRIKSLRFKDNTNNEEDVKFGSKSPYCLFSSIKSLTKFGVWTIIKKVCYQNWYETSTIAATI